MAGSLRPEKCRHPYGTLTPGWNSVTMTRRPRTIGLLGAIAVLALACGGTGESSSTADTDVAAASTPTTPDAASTDSTASSPANGSDGDGTDAPDSLEGYLGVAANAVRRGSGGGGGGAGLAAADVEAIAEQQQLIEIEVQICMQAQGFTYVPEDNSDGVRFFASAANEGISEADYAATEGFGISTRFDAIFEGDIDLTESSDPNEEHLAGLSEGERDAWQFALRGQPPERNEDGRLIDPETGEVLPAGRGQQATGGCQLEAQEAVRGDLDALDDLADAFAELDERIEADPRITELRREWSACMLDRGFDYDDVDDARANFTQQIRPLLRSFFQSSGVQAGPGAGGAGALQALADAGLTDEQEAELSQLQDLEIATAVASLECGGDSPDEIAEITARYEAEFVAENRAALEAFAN